MKFLPEHLKLRSAEAKGFVALFLLTIFFVIQFLSLSQNLHNDADSTANVPAYVTSAKAAVTPGGEAPSAAFVLAVLECLSLLPVEPTFRFAFASPSFCLKNSEAATFSSRAPPALN